MEKEKIIETEHIYKGKIINLDKNKVVCPNNIVSYREIIHHPGGVCILVKIDDKFVLIKQYRSPYDDFIYELPAGKLEKGEDPLSAGKRELEEEVGLLASNWISYGSIYPSVGYTDEIIYLYSVSGITKSKQHLDVDEQIEICYFSKEELLKMIDNGDIKDAKTLILLLRYFAEN